jgi:hypothetical protein
MDEEAVLRTPLSVICKRIVGICAICKNRKDQEEIFTGLQICKPCHAFHTLKISYFRFRQLFLVTEVGLEARVHGTGQSLIREKCRYPKNDPQCPLLHWGDICDLIKRKYIVRDKTAYAESYLYSGRFGEDFGLFDIGGSCSGQIRDGNLSSPGIKRS